MNSKTITKVFSTTQQAVFDYFANIENIPTWAPGFCKQLKRMDGQYKIIMGAIPGQEVELFMKIEGDAKTGTIDFHVGPDLMHMELLPGRVVSKGNNTTVLLMTFFQEPYMDEEVFARRWKNLENELNILACLI